MKTIMTQVIIVHHHLFQKEKKREVFTDQLLKDDGEIHHLR